MIFTLRTIKALYKRDLKRLLIYNLKDDFYLKLLIRLYLIILVFFALNYFKIITLIPKVFGFLSFVLGIGILGMLIHIVIQFYLQYRIIKKKSTLVENILEEIKFCESYIEVSRNGTKKKYSWDSFKYALKLKNTFFLTPINQKDDFLRFNKDELIKGDFDSIISFVEKKWCAISNGNSS